MVILVGGLSGNLLSASISTTDFGVGASTSLFAVLAAVCLKFYLQYDAASRVQSQYAILFLIMMGFALMNGLVSTSAGVDAYGHIGGFIAGLLLALGFMANPDQDPHLKIRRVKPFAIIALVLFLTGVSVLLFMRKIPGCEDPLGFLYCSLMCAV